MQSFRVRNTASGRSVARDFAQMVCESGEIPCYRDGVYVGWRWDFDRTAFTVRNGRAIAVSARRDFAIRMAKGYRISF